MNTGLTRIANFELPDEIGGAVDDRLAAAADQNVAARIADKDDTLWGKAGAAEVSDRLGWTDIHDRMATQVPELVTFARRAYEDGLRHVVVLGMGGSSLAPEVFRQSFPKNKDALELHVLDSTDAQAVRDIEAMIALDKTLFVVSSKSGGTVETLSALHHFWAETGERGEQFVAITDPGSELEKIATDRGFRHVFGGDPDIGGRYSALSPFGIVPAALAGFDVESLLAGGSAVAAACRERDPYINPGVRLGSVLGELALARRDKLTFFVDEPVASFGLWVEQLIAESLGKRGKGLLPIAGEPSGTEASYGKDRAIVYLQGAKGEQRAAAAALTDDGFPVITMPVGGAADLGALMVLWEYATAVCGWVLEINPFDQPDVQSAKDKTKEVLSGEPPLIEPADHEQLAALFDAGPPSYLCIQAYCQPDAALDRAIAELRVAIREKTKMATTFGYGPRYLHSTGQLHKGGAANGRFLQLLAMSPPDIDAGEPAGTFETLKRAQADGDLLVLRDDHDRPVERVLLTGDLDTVVRSIKEHL